jgi:hypothetical protein
MQIDLNYKSQQLLEALANSIHDRDPHSTNPFWFNISEVHVAEKWLADFVVELMDNIYC